MGHSPARVMPSAVSDELSRVDEFAGWASGLASRERSDEALQQELGAIADGVADLVRIVAQDHPEVVQDRQDLLRATGLENRESA